MKPSQPCALPQALLHRPPAMPAYGPAHAIYQSVIWPAWRELLSQQIKYCAGKNTPPKFARLSKASPGGDVQAYPVRRQVLLLTVHGDKDLLLCLHKAF